MSFDISRVTFDPWKDFSSVVMQQGRVQLDSDWNEWLAELTRRVRAGTLDIVGRAVYPATTPNAFLITPQGSSINIGVGRMYVDGLLAENHGLPEPGSGGWIPPNPGAPGPQPGWDPVLDELVGQNAITYEQQPYFPGVTQQSPFPTTGGPFLIYLDVWQREVTFLEAPDLVEKAVGVDTTGRLQTVWQVRWLDVSSSGNVTCSSKDSDITAWNNLIQPSAARLTTGVVQFPSSGPCCLAPNTGYTGMENQLYRVEIHQVSNAPPTFKWSRNNASVATAVTGISQDRFTLTVESTGRDDVLRFSQNDWVEVTDDWLELNGQPGILLQIASNGVTDSTNTITLTSALPAGTFPVDANGLTNPERHTRVIKWDQQGKVFKSDGTTVWKDLDTAGTGDIPVPPPGTALILENGVTVAFDLDPSTGAFNVGDHWNFAARTLDGTVENLVKAPPRGIHHHYARLAMFTPGQKPSDCRIEWPPTCEGGCDCASCVTADSHNSGKWTIQQAIDAVLLAGGGKVCLGPGIYNITTMINIAGENLPVSNLAISGHGLPVLAPTAQFQDSSIVSIQNALDIEVNGIAFSCGSPGANEQGVVVGPAGLSIAQAGFVLVEHCSFGLNTDTAQLSPAIAFSGLLLNCTLRENLFMNVQLGVGLASSNLLAITGLNMEYNQMLCTDGAVDLGAPEGLLATEVRFANNFVQSASGFVLLGLGLDVAVEENTFSITAATSSRNEFYGNAVVCNVSQLRVANNEISRSAGPITLSSAAATGALSAASYLWVVTAVETSGRELLITQLATLALAAPSSVTLQWSAVAGIESYNVYRSTANDPTLRLVSGVKPNGSPTLTFVDKTPDQTLAQQPALPAMQNDGIVLGSPSSASLMYGTQIKGNRIAGLTGTGVVSLARTVLDETVIAGNQLQLLGEGGLLLNSVCLDLDINGNSLVGVWLLADGQNPSPAIAARIGFAFNGDISENRIEQVGPPVAITKLPRRGIQLFGEGVRIAGNLIIDVGPTSVLSQGILAAVTGRLEVESNEVRRASQLPAKIDQSLWFAAHLYGETVSVLGNLLESFGSEGKDHTTPGTAAILAQVCTFNNNQCFLRDPDPSAQALVAEVAATEAIIAMGNLVQGPKKLRASTRTTPAQSSLELILTNKVKDPPPITVIGNVTSAGIFVTPAMAPAMEPLNIIL